MKAWLQRSMLRVAVNMLIVSLIVCQVSAQATLVAQWTFEGDATDVSGNGYDGELLGSAEFSTSAKQGSQCLYLEGTSSCVNAGEIDLGDEFSVAAWVYLDFSDAEPRDIQTIVANCEGGALVDGFKVYVNDWETSNHRIRVETANVTSRKDAITAEDVFEEEYWNHVAVTVDVLEGLVEIFYNGEDITSDGISATDFQTSGEFWIGAMHATNYPWGGMIDDVRLYDGLLTQEEVAAIMGDIASDVQEPAPILPASYALGENYPNPFNPTTTIPYTLAKTSDVRLEIFDHLGQLVQVMVDGVQSPGTYEAHFSAQNVASGIYFYKLTAGSYVNLKKMILIK